jgi:hypothetical protein
MTETVILCGGGPLSLDEQYAADVLAEQTPPAPTAYVKALDVGEAERETVAVHTVVTECRRRIQEAEWELGSALKLVRDHGLWASPPLALDAWDDYLQHPDVDLSPQKARRLIRCVERYRPLVKAGVCTDADLAEMGTTKGDLLRQALDRDPDHADEWIEKGKRLSRTDLKKELRRADPAQPHSAAALDFLEAVSAKLCGMAGHLPDAPNPLDTLDKLVREAHAAAAEWQATYCEPPAAS